MLGNIREVNRREKFAAIAYQNGAVQANGAYLERLHSIIGARNIAKYNALRRRSMQELQASIRELPKSERGKEKLAEIRRAQARKSATQIKALGVDLAEVRRLQKEFEKGKEALLEATLERDGINASRLPKKKNTTAKPPYDGWAWRLTRYIWTNHSDFKEKTSQGIYDNQWQVPPTANPETGNVACNHGLGVKNAIGDVDQIVTAAAAVFKWFKMPEGAGLNPLSSVRVRAKLATAAKYQ